ncbi:MAG TPA: hypothetical protein IAC14_14165 [Candidatus Scybalomonas excrementigallinarum]|nr:hypothetical protein [Candidatus Scybalomonas excrementigallinarum]
MKLSDLDDNTMLLIKEKEKAIEVINKRELLKTDYLLKDLKNKKYNLSVAGIFSPRISFDYIFKMIAKNSGDPIWAIEIMNELNAILNIEEIEETINKVLEKNYLYISKQEVTIQE